MIHRKLRSRLTAPRGSEALVGTLFDERYRVHAWIGGGAFSNVYHATEGGGGGPALALKIIRKGQSDHARSQTGMVESHAFEHEVRYNQMIRSPALARSYRASRTRDGIDYIVMELVRGEALDQRIRRRGALELGHVRLLAEQLLEFLKDAHGRGIAHGDLKSGNLLVCDREAFRVKVIDLGHARSFSGGGHASAHLVGTPGFLAPELVDGGVVEPRAEMFAVATILYHATTGELPVQTPRNIAEERLEYLRDPSKPIPSRPARELRPDCPPAFDQALAWALARNPGSRPPSVRAFGERLAQSFEDFPAAPPWDFDVEAEPSRLERFFDWIQDRWPFGGRG